jgi:putative flippase GtrA
MILTRQVLRFLVTGAVNSVFGYLVYACGILAGLPYFWAVVLAYIIGTTFSYLTFRAFVFTDGDRSWKTYQRFLPVYFFLFVFNEVALFVLVDMMGVHKLWAQAFVVPVCAIMSYGFNRLFVFKK